MQTASDFALVLKNTGIVNAPDCWEEAYPDSQRFGDLPDSALLAQLMELVQLPEEFCSLLSETVDRIDKSEHLQKLTKLWNYLVFARDASGSNKWPLPESLGDTLKPMFPAALLVSALSQMLDIHEDLDVPGGITMDCLLDIDIWARDYFTAHGKWGFDELEWLQPAFVGKLFRLGRLQFIYKQYSGNYKVYRNRHNKELIALANAGMKFRKDGLVDGTNDLYDPDAWTADLVESTDSITGWSISREGYATGRQIILNLEDWELLLTEGSGLLDVHIPAGENLDYTACLDSYETAQLFFEEHLPEQVFAGFYCQSWLMDPSLQNILHADSDIIKFQKHYYLLPVKSSSSQTMQRVFRCQPENLASAPEVTSLQKGIKAHIAAGKNVHEGSGFFPAEQ